MYLSLYMYIYIYILYIERKRLFATVGCPLLYMWGNRCPAGRPASRPRSPVTLLCHAPWVRMSRGMVVG